jgi:hypothetical protein
MVDVDCRRLFFFRKKDEGPRSEMNMKTDGKRQDELAIDEWHGMARRVRDVTYDLRWEMQDD